MSGSAVRSRAIRASVMPWGARLADVPTRTPGGRSSHFRALVVRELVGPNGPDRLVSETVATYGRVDVLVNNIRTTGSGRRGLSTSL